MPYPVQMHREQVLEIARQMIEAEGEEHLSLARLATALGVRAPSLYRLFEHRAALLRAVNTATLGRLFEAMNAALQAGCEPADQFLRVAQAYHTFALDNPRAYVLAMATASDELRPDEELLLRLVLPLQASMAAISGEAHSLAALRGALALVHGFVMLELNRQLRRGGDLEADFLLAVQAYLRGWSLEAGLARPGLA